jgi:hypothetical protein
LYLPDELYLRPTSSLYTLSTTIAPASASVPAQVAIMPATPVYSTLTTPNTMSPLFPSSVKSGSSSIRSSYEYNTAIHTNYNVNKNPHPYVVPGDVPYFNPGRHSNDTTHSTIGLNASNERL